MYVLVSTPRFIICHDTNSAKSEILESGRGNYYGITWNADGSELALSHSGIDEQSLVDLASYATSEQGFLTIGAKTTWKFLSAPHQILWVDGEIVVTNTGRNALTRLNPGDHSIIQYRYDAALWDRLSTVGFDGAHLNSLYSKGDSLYAVAHNFDKGSYILELDWPSLEEKERRPVRDATGIHNLWIDENGRFIVCDSNNGSLIDAYTSEILWSGPSGNYTRGLAATDDTILVGQSAIASRAGRSFSETGLCILDRSFRTVDYQHLGNFGAVQDIRIVDVPDLCHHGKPLSMDTLDGLRARTGQISQHRLAKTKAAESVVKRWRIVRGHPDLVEPGNFAPTDSQLLLCIEKEPALGIGGKLRWRIGPGTSHASLVVNYTGPGDQNMAAALFEQSNSGALVASIWINCGEWKMLCSRPVPTEFIRRHERGLELILQAHFQRIGPNLELRLWDEHFFSAAADDSLVGEHAGIRMLGHSFEFRDVQGRTTAS